MNIRLKIANMLYKLFPTRFCWADLATWSMGGEPFFRPLKLWQRPGGCITQSKDEITQSCYCGCWYKGKNCNTKEGRELLKEIERETEELITNEPPF